MKIKNMILMIILMNLVIIPAIAQQTSEDVKWCCLENFNGHYCREYSTENISQYCNMSDDNNYHRGKCVEVGDPCKEGCCYNSLKQCGPASKLECESNGNEWFDDVGCNLPQCEKGCCILGTQVSFTTSEGCDLLASDKGLPKNFDLGFNAGECYDLVGLQNYGACLVDEHGSCVFTTKEQCIAQAGDVSRFHKDYLCSHSDLNTNCEAKFYTGCVEGKYEVYWFDSCGNRENIYGTLNDNGLLKSKSQSCVLELDTNQASCGNCDIGSSVCGLPIESDANPNYGDYVCRDVRCIDEQGNTRENGESWCVYEGKVGEGRDVAGSSHWKYYCQNAEVKSENCDEKREKICVEQTDDNDFTSASCINNEWERCLDYNLAEEGMNWLEEYNLLNERIQSCGEDKFCYVKRMYLGGVEIPGIEAYSVCVPKWPVGFYLETNAQKELAIETCSLGSKRIICRGTYGKCISEFNDLCINMGDCGAYVNLNGNYTEGGVAKYYGTVHSSIAEIWDGVYAIPDSKIDEYISNSEPDSDYTILVDELIPEDEIDETENSDANQGYNRASINRIDGTLYIHPAYRSKYLTVKFIPGFQCLPWQAPIDGVCESCSEDPLKPCTPYRCQSMGRSCKLINEGDEGYELCFRSQEYDITPPVITGLIDVQNPGLSYDPHSNINGYQLWNDERSDGCIEAYSDIQFGIKTNEPAVCRFSRAPVPYTQEFDFSSLPELFGGHNYFDYNHTLNTSLPSIESMANYYEVDLEYTRQNYGLYQYYIRCEDVNGNSNINEYLVKMCVNPEPDIQAPFIKSFMPAQNNYFKYGISEYPLHIWTDEQANCSITDNIIDKENYDAMTPMSCRNNYTQKENNGWRCSTTLTGLQNNKKYYIKCKDKPWLPENNETRRLMAQSREYTVKVTEEALAINSMTINSMSGENIEIFSNTEYASATLDVITSGGADNGEPTCYWKKSETANYGGFAEPPTATAPNRHRQIWSALNNGTHTIYIYCVDNIGNNVTNQTTFKVTKDTDNPVIVRMYYNNQLKIITNEDSRCRYSNNFTDNWENKTSMGEDPRVHTSPWYEDKTYYIQCEDDYENRISIENQIVIVSYEENPN